MPKQILMTNETKQIEEVTRAVNDTLNALVGHTVIPLCVANEEILNRDISECNKVSVDLLSGDFLKEHLDTIGIPNQKFYFKNNDNCMIAYPESYGIYKNIEKEVRDYLYSEKSNPFVAKDALGTSDFTKCLVINDVSSLEKNALGDRLLDKNVKLNWEKNTLTVPVEYKDIVCSELAFVRLTQTPEVKRMEQAAVNARNDLLYSVWNKKEFYACSAQDSSFLHYHDINKNSNSQSKFVLDRKINYNGKDIIISRVNIRENNSDKIEKMIAGYKNPLKFKDRDFRNIPRDNRTKEIEQRSRQIYGEYNVGKLVKANQLLNTLHRKIHEEIAGDYNEALAALQRGDNFSKIYNAAVEELEEAGIMEYELETELKEFLDGTDYEQTDFERAYIRSVANVEGRLEMIETAGLEKEKTKVEERINAQEKERKENIKDELTLAINEALSKNENYEEEPEEPEFDEDDIIDYDI